MKLFNQEYLMCL